MLTAQEIKDGIAKAVAKYENEDVDGRVIASLFALALPDATAPAKVRIRYSVCRWLLGKGSTKGMTGAERAALSRWLTGKPDAFFGAPLRDSITGEIQRVYDAALQNEGQQELFDREAQIKKELGFG